MEKRLQLLMVVVGALIAPAGMAAAQGQQILGSITGGIVARDTGQAVLDATVRVEGTAAAVAANALGRFRIDGLKPGAAVLVVQAPGFLEQRVTGLTVRPGDISAGTIVLEPTPNFMDRVQVTATKSPVTIGDVAAPAEVITAAMIEARGDQTLPQALAHVPGAVLSTQLGVFDSVMLRGMPRDSVEFTNTLLLVDGVPQTNGNNAARVTALPINDANAIEVVRGPNSALYGRTAIGGSINVRTADPTPDHQVALDFIGGSFAAFRGGGRISGPVNDWGGYYISIGGQRDGGYFETTGDYSVGNSSVFGKLAFTTDPRSAGFVSINRVISHNSTPTNEPIIEGRLLHEIDPRFKRLTSFNIPGPNYNQEETRLTLNYARRLAPWINISEVFGYRSVLHQFNEDGDFIAGPFDLEAGTVTMYPFSQDLNEDNFYQELRAELSPVGSRLKQLLTVGASYERNSGSISSDFIFTDEDLGGWTISYVTPVIPPRAQWQHDESSRVYHLGNTGLFAQYMVEPLSRLVITAGGRYDRLAMDATRQGGNRAEVTPDAFSPKVSATVRVLGAEDQAPATVNVYAAYSQAFLPPRRPSSLVPADVALNLDPEDITNYEGGIKGSLLNGRASFEATYFQMKEDGVVLTTRQGPFFLPTNSGQQKYKGVETGGRFQFSPRASGYFNASFYRNRFGNFVIQSEDGDEVLTGNRLPISPDHVVNWGMSLALRPDLDANFDVKHVGAVQTNRENTFELGGYALVDAAVTWRHGPLRFTLSAHNLLNEEYYWNGDGEVADPGRPRQVLLSTSFLLK